MYCKLLAEKLRAQFPGISGDTETLAKIAQALHREMVPSEDAEIFEALGMPPGCAIDYLQAVLDHLPISINIKRLDHSFLISNRADADAAFAGRNPKEIRNKTDHDFFDPTLVPFWEAEENEVFAGKPAINNYSLGDVTSRVIKKPIYNNKGNIIGLMSTSFALNMPSTSAKRALSVINELRTKEELITKLQAQLVENTTLVEELRLKEQTAHIFMSTSSESIFYEDLVTGKITFLNIHSKYKGENFYRDKILGLTNGDILNKSFIDFVAPGWREYFQEKTAKGYTTEIETFMLNSAGQEIPCTINIGLDKDTAQVIYAVNDCSEDRLDEDTHLPLKKSFAAFFEMSLAHALRYNANLAIIMLDMNGLKDLNDTISYAYADFIVLEISKLLSTSFKRETDFVSRVNRDQGDEFYVLLYDYGSLENLHEMIHSFTQTVVQKSFSLSIGVVPITPQDIPTKASESFVEEMLTKADEIMHQAKKETKEIIVPKEKQTRSLRRVSAYRFAGESRATIIAP